LFARILYQPVLIIGVLLLVLALITSLMRGRGGPGGSNKMWRGERIAYGSPYGESWLARLRRLFRGR
jgi:hypothetical protein